MSDFVPVDTNIVLAVDEDTIVHHLVFLDKNDEVLGYYKGGEYLSPGELDDDDLDWVEPQDQTPELREKIIENFGDGFQEPHEEDLI